MWIIKIKKYTFSYKHNYNIKNVGIAVHLKLVIFSLYIDSIQDWTGMSLYFIFHSFIFYCSLNSLLCKWLCKDQNFNFTDINIYIFDFVDISESIHRIRTLNQSHRLTLFLELTGEHILASGVLEVIRCT